ncbi:pheromone A receptor-domain-containing protein [Flagelloscypha sp. PMI_526]|nr:pheromone A receptor-domain-containing protein [Flagelloscypha sp. PMI_526]
MPHPEFAPIAFLCAAALLLPLPWHWRAGNVATVSIVFWLFFSNVKLGVDAVLWSDNVRIQVPVWCDITTKFLVGANVALPAACLCLSMHLARIASVRAAVASTSDKKRQNIFEGFMCFGLPIIFMALHYIVQGHRFDIIEEFGCRATTYFSIPGLFLFYLPPLVLALAALVYSAIALHHFFIRRLTFAAHLQTSHTSLTTSRYLRLMAMATIQMFWSLTFSLFSLIFAFSTLPLLPWTNWDDVHFDWLRIAVFPMRLFAAALPKNMLNVFTILWWGPPLSALVFVGFFAFGAEAVQEYKNAFYSLGGLLPSKFRSEKFGLSESKKALHLPRWVSYKRFDKAGHELLRSSPTTTTYSTATLTPLTPITPPPKYAMPERPLTFASSTTTLHAIKSKASQLLVPNFMKSPKHEKSFETTSSFCAPSLTEFPTPPSVAAPIKRVRRPAPAHFDLTPQNGSVRPVHSLFPETAYFAPATPLARVHVFPTATPITARTPLRPPPLHSRQPSRGGSPVSEEEGPMPYSATGPAFANRSPNYNNDVDELSRPLPPLPIPATPATAPTPAFRSNLPVQPVRPVMKPRPLTYPSHAASISHRGSVVPDEWIDLGGKRFGGNIPPV